MLVKVDGLELSKRSVLVVEGGVDGYTRAGNEDALRFWDLTDEVASGRPARLANDRPLTFVLTGPQSIRRTIQYPAGAAHAAGEIRLQWLTRRSCA